MKVTKQKQYSVLKAALMLKTNSVDLYRKLRFAGLLHSTKKHWNLPRERFIRAGLFSTTYKIYPVGDVTRISEKTMITEAGLGYIKDLLNGTCPALLLHKKSKETGLNTLHKLQQQLAG
jgi:phage antirepressor YoqD-like protein